MLSAEEQQLRTRAPVGTDCCRIEGTKDNMSTVLLLYWDLTIEILYWPNLRLRWNKN